MELTLYCSSEPSIRFDDDRNKLFAAVPGLLDEMERRGAKVRRVDPHKLTPEKLRDAYAKAIIPAVYKKYEVKKMFGTNRHSACFFGCEVPALVVKQPSDPIGDTYPHRQGGNSIITIQEFLRRALAATSPRRG